MTEKLIVWNSLKFQSDNFSGNFPWNCLILWENNFSLEFHQIQTDYGFTEIPWNWLKNSLKYTEKKLSDFFSGNFNQSIFFGKFPEIFRNCFQPSNIMSVLVEYFFEASKGIFNERVFQSIFINCLNRETTLIVRKKLKNF